MKTRPIKVLFLAVLASTSIYVSSMAYAGPKCTDAPEDQWISEATMKEKIAEMGYKNIRVFKKTKGNCYEIYGYTRNGKKAEVYFHPVDGSVVKEEIK